MNLDYLLLLDLCVLRHTPAVGWGRSVLEVNQQWISEL